MSNEIVAQTAPVMSMSEQMQFSEIVTAGDLVPQAYRGKPANALVAIGLGQAMGLTPAESLYRIDVIQGKPTASAELIASNVRKAGHKLRVEVDEQAKSVRATIWRADDPEYPHTVVRDMAWAQQMGLANKDNYKKQPTTMLQWRAISAVARLACSEALYGVTYTPDEVQDMGELKTPHSTPQPTPEPVPAVEGISQEQWETIKTMGAERGLDPALLVEGIQKLLGRTIPGPQGIRADEYQAIINTLGANNG